MFEEKDVLEALQAVVLPRVGRSLIAMNLVRSVKVESTAVRISIADVGFSSVGHDRLSEQIVKSLAHIPTMGRVAIEFCSAAPCDLNRIKHVVGVMSAKGGVGKSTVSGLLAAGARRMSREVGILDADITMAAIPHIFGVNKRPSANESGMLPVSSASGVQIMSMSLMLPHADDPLNWRGPLIAGTIKEFREKVLWGNLDILIVDLPPGTSDAPLTVASFSPLSGFILVFTPQVLAQKGARKSIRWAQKLQLPIIGIVENMVQGDSHDGGDIERWPSRVADEEQLSSSAHSEILGRIPLDSNLARLCDGGRIEEYRSPPVDDMIEHFLHSLDFPHGHSHA